MASYFHVVITDGHKQMKGVGFSPGQRKRLASSKSAMDATAHERCVFHALQMQQAIM